LASRPTDKEITVNTQGRYVKNTLKMTRGLLAGAMTVLAGFTFSAEAGVAWGQPSYLSS
jgi:hypothetical protein